MKSINDIINESKTIDSGLLEFKDGSDSVVSIVTSTTGRDYYGRTYESGAAGTGVIV